MTSARDVNSEDGGLLCASRCPQVQVSRRKRETDLSWKAAERRLCDSGVCAGDALGMLGKSKQL